ncbi:MAG: B12-binding domain-containing radical SAM protein [Magnetococcales bacterium]|nr:B12-binding domain-containing radical SAM protein [Magnetococcales bacterium]NGZ25664.1 B12-binding domain-containing radical SAM protein [Magnetococcales bacterium]
MNILLVVYDNDSYIHWFPQGTAYVAAVLRKAGHQVTLYSQDLHHYPDHHLTQWLDEHDYDVVGLGVIAGYYQYKKLLKLAEAINASRKRPFFVLGGHGPTPDPAFFMKKTSADAVVMGEGELTVVELVDALANRTPLRQVKGIAFMENGQAIITPTRPLIQDLDTIPLPAYDLFPMEYYRLLRMPHCTASDFVMPVLSGRGCTFRCIFCYRMDKGFRPRSVEGILDEIELLKKNYGITYVAFSDELLMSSESRTEEICQGMIQRGLNVKWDCNGRLNYAKPALLQLMRQAGCVFINYGIEAMDDEVLQRMHKGLRVRQITKGIEATLAAGISPGFNIIFGNPGDNVQTLNKGVEFLLRYDDGSQMRTIRPVTPYPGSPLYQMAIDQGLLRDCEDFYENKHTNSDLLAVNFTELSDEAFHTALCEANSRLITNYFDRRKEQVLEQAQRLYHQQDASFRGFRQT